MNILSGGIYFVSDDFFMKINDPFLKINYSHTKRPHYFAFKDTKTELFWFVPCSSKVEKFKRILKDKEAKHKQTDGIKIVIIRRNENVLLFQDMFPIIEKYIAERYIRDNEPVAIYNTNEIEALQKHAIKVIKLLHRGIKFTPTQPDVLRIEKLMLDELSLSRAKEKKKSGFER